MSSQDSVSRVDIRLPLLTNLLLFIRDSGGSVSIRQVARRFSWCRPCGRAEEQLKVLAAAGLGSWHFPQLGRRGGRPRKQFVLNQSLPDDLQPEEECSVRGKNPAHLTQLMMAQLLMWVQQQNGKPLSAVSQALRKTAATVDVLNRRRGTMGGLLNEKLSIERNGSIKVSWCYHGKPRKSANS